MTKAMVELIDTLQAYADEHTLRRKKMGLTWDDDKICMCELCKKTYEIVEEYKNNPHGLYTPKNTQLGQ